jgi:hypothetical protein
VDTAGKLSHPVAGPALAVGLGLVWALAVENLLRGVAGLLDWLRPITDHLPGSAAGSLAAAVGAVPAGRPDGTPGVVTSLTGSVAVVTAAVYLVIFVVCSRRRCYAAATWPDRFIGAGLMVPSISMACHRQNIPTVHTLRELSATPARWSASSRWA